MRSNQHTWSVSNLITELYNLWFYQCIRQLIGTYMYHGITVYRPVLSSLESNSLLMAHVSVSPSYLECIISLPQNSPQQHEWLTGLAYYPFPLYLQTSQPTFHSFVEAGITSWNVSLTASCRNSNVDFSSLAVYVTRRHCSPELQRTSTSFSDVLHVSKFIDMCSFNMCACGNLCHWGTFDVDMFCGETSTLKDQILDADVWLLNRWHVSTEMLMLAIWILLQTACHTDKCHIN